MTVTLQLARALFFTTPSMFVVSADFPPVTVAQLREWTLRADPMHSALASSLTPHLLVAHRDNQGWTIACIEIGAYHLLPRMIDSVQGGHLIPYTRGQKLHINYLANSPQMHTIDLRPFLGLFKLGLDPFQQLRPVQGVSVIARVRGGSSI